MTGSTAPPDAPSPSGPKPPSAPKMKVTGPRPAGVIKGHVYKRKRSSKTSHMETVLEEYEEGEEYNEDEVPLSRRTWSVGFLKRRTFQEEGVHIDLEEVAQEEPVNPMDTLGDDEFDISEFEGLHGFKEVEKQILVEGPSTDQKFSFSFMSHQTQFTNPLDNVGEEVL